jgi:hypothetical protein
MARPLAGGLPAPGPTPAPITKTIDADWTRQAQRAAVGRFGHLFEDTGDGQDG